MYCISRLYPGPVGAEEMIHGQIDYVPPYWANRSINIGNEPIISSCVHPGDAGHNYGDIAEEGFLKRVFQRYGKIVIA